MASNNMSPADLRAELASCRAQIARLRFMGVLLAAVVVLHAAQSFYLSRENLKTTRNAVDYMETNNDTIRDVLSVQRAHEAAIKELREECHAPR